MSVKIGAGMSVPKSSVQSVIFNKKYYTEDQARRWLYSHSFKTNYKPKPDITESEAPAEPRGSAEQQNFIRYRQFEPPVGGKYITKIISRGIELIILL